MSAHAAGGFSVSPAVLVTVARPGQLGAVTLANATASPIRVVVRPRPWRQPRSGVVVSDARRTLERDLRVSPSSFTLSAGQRRAVSVNLLRLPAAGSLYGNLEVVGTPQGMQKAIRTRYRLITGVRLNPPTAKRVLKVRVGRIRASRRGGFIAVRNEGNTVMPLTGSARVVGATGTLRTTIAEARILPGAIVDVSLRSGRLLGGR